MQLEGGDKHKGEVWVDLLGWFQGEVTIEEDVRLSFSLFRILPRHRRRDRRLPSPRASR